MDERGECWRASIIDFLISFKLDIGNVIVDNYFKAWTAARTSSSNGSKGGIKEEW